jgi:predicted DNA-binding transcriptional regulator YafY
MTRARTTRCSAASVTSRARPARAKPSSCRGGGQVLTLSFEHELAAVHRLAGFGDQIEVLDPPTVRARLLATAREILGRYDAAK